MNRRHRMALTPAQQQRSSLGVIFLTVLLDLLGFGIVIPILPLYAEKLHATDFETGILLASYSVMQLIFSPVWGRLSDRAGRRPILLLSIFGSCASQLGYALAPTFWWLVVARAFAGVCGANITAAQAYIADVTDESKRAAGMGMLGAAMGLGFVFGPAVGGFLSQRSANLPFFVAAGLAGFNFISAVIILKEPRTAAQRTRARTLTWAGLVRTASTPRLLTLMLLFFVVTFGFANLEATFSLYLERRFQYGRREASYMFTYIGVLMVIVQGGLVRRLVPRFGEKRLIVIGTLLMGVGFLMQYGADNVKMLLVALAVTATGNGLNTPSLSSLISRAASGDHQGGVLGVSQAMGALARVVGPLIGTWTLHYGMTFPYLTGGVTMIVACLFASAFVRQPPEPAPVPAATS
ncbi:MAG: major facilitator superfamily 1 [Myxococcales bacterium]|nr:major facilitator superfamily 1 [Myxococcales bacterium]